MPKFRDKADYRGWCNKPDTEHVFYSLAEGLTGSLRTTTASNPPWMIHGLVGEFDKEPGEDWRKQVRAGEIPPTWASRSFSGNMRLIWAFERPVGYSNQALGKEFYKAAWKAIQPLDLGTGFRREESEDPARYFELGHEWEAIGAAIPAHTLEAWIFKAVKQVKWDREAAVLPFDEIQKEGEAQFPGRWPGGWETFVPGARGCRFWEPGADAQSVIVVDSGCICFTGDRPFLPWADIFGRAFVNRASDQTIGKAIVNLWWEADKSCFWKKYDDGSKQPIRRREDLILHLTKHGLTKVVPKGESHSQVENAIWAIQNTKALAGVFPAMYHPEDTVRINGDLYLNTSTLRLTQPAGEKTSWGQGFPVTAEFLEKLFRQEQLPYFLGWLAHFYRSCLAGSPERGLALFLAGPVGTGKSFLSFAIMSQLLGSHQDAGMYLTAQDKFNEHLVASPLWTIDDAAAATDAASRNKYSQLVKMAVANDHLICRGMHRSGFIVPWRGRIVVTMNDDSESARMIPNLEMSIQDKIMLLKAYPVPDLTWANEHDGRYPTDAEIAGELPWLGAYLRDMSIPARIWAGSRFGVKPYHHPELLDIAEDASDTAAAIEVIQMWRKQWFAMNPEAAYWRGTAAELHETVTGTLDRVGSMQFRSAQSLGVAVNKIINRGAPWIYKRRSNGERFIFVEGITKPSLAVTVGTVGTKNSDGSKSRHCSSVTD